jgi:outer membrane protein TolC
MVLLPLFLFVLCFCPVQADGETDKAGEEPVILNLKELEALALKNNPLVEKARFERDMASDDLNKARAAYLPQMDTLFYSGPVNKAKVPFVRDGEIVSRASKTDLSSLTVFARIELTVTQPLYTFGKISHREKAAEIGLNISEDQQERVKREIMRDVRTRYYAYILALMGEAAVAEGKQFLDDIKEKMEGLLKVKASNVEPSDQYRLESYWGEMKHNEAKMRSGKEVAYLALKTVTGYPENKEFRVQEKQLPGVDKRLKDKSYYINKALNSRPELQSLRKAVEAKRCLWQAAGADMYPDFFAALGAGVARSPGRDRLNDPYFNDNFNEEYAGVVLGGKWHFDFGLLKADRDKAMADVLALERQKVFAEENIALETANYYSDLVAARDSVQGYIPAYKAAQKWLVTSLANVDMGLGSFREVFEALDQYDKNKGGHLLSLYDFNVAKAQLWYAAGISGELEE